MNLRTKLNVISYVLILAPVIVVSTVAFVNMYDNIKQEVKNYLLATNNLKASQLQQWISSNARSLEELALTPQVRNYTKVLATHSSEDSEYHQAWESIISVYFSPRLWYGSFTGFILLDALNGSVLASTNLETKSYFNASQPYYTQGKMHTYVQGIYYNEELHQATISISTPVRDENLETTGVLIGHLSMVELSGIMSLRTGLKTTEDTYLVNREGYFLTEPRSGERFVMKEKVSPEIVSTGFVNRESIISYYNYQNIRVIGALRWLPLYDLLMVTEVRTSEAFAYFYRMFWVIFGITVLLMMVAVIVTSLFSRSITSSLITLVKGTREIGSGNLDYRLEINSRDEVGELARAFENMAENLKKITVSRDELARSERSLAAAQELARLGSWDKDLNTGRGDWSAEMFRLFGFDPAKGVPYFDEFLQRVHHEDRHIFIEKEEECVRTGRKQIFEFRSNPDTGPEKFFICILVPQVDEQGKVVKLSGITQDITELRRAQEEVERLNRELEQRVIQRTAQLEATNKELEAFVYSVSHDLRAPLRSINGFSEALLEDYQDKLDESGRDYLNRIQNSARRMDELITDLLTLSRVTRYEIQEEDVDLSALVGRIIDGFAENKIERQVDVVIQENIRVHSDRRLLEIMLTNLLDNAWKFTGKTPHARIEFGSYKENGNTVFYVKDNGAGFDMTYADKLFVPFQRLHNSDEFPGTGIGLAIVQRIINRLGGRIWAEGEIDKGATFYFTLR